MRLRRSGGDIQKVLLLWGRSLEQKPLSQIRGSTFSRFQHTSNPQPIGGSRLSGKAPANRHRAIDDASQPRCVSHIRPSPRRPFRLKRSFNAKLGAAQVCQGLQRCVLRCIGRVAAGFAAVQKSGADSESIRSIGPTHRVMAVAARGEKWELLLKPVIRTEGQIPLVMPDLAHNPYPTSGATASESLVLAQTWS